MFTNNAISHAYIRTFGKHSSVGALFPIRNYLNELWGGHSDIVCKSICELMALSHIKTLSNGHGCAMTSYKGGVVFGDGTAEPTMDDYCLSGNVVSSFNETNTIELTKDETTGIVTISKKYTITNTGSSPITISEIALIDNFKNSYYYFSFVVDRTLLDNPVTIPAGGTGYVTYTIEVTL